MEAIQALLDLHGAALQRILDLAGPEVAARLAADEAVGGLLLVHGLHPVALEERVRLALDGVRPYLGSHGGGVEVLEVSDGVVRLRLEGSCHGCPSSTATLRDAIEQAILERAPDVVRLDVEGVVEPRPPAGFVALGSIKGPGPAATWRAVEGLGDASLDVVAARDVAGTRIAFCVSGGQRYAYLDRCPGCESGLAGAPVEAGIVACPRCARRYDVRRAGLCPDDPELHLGPVPLLAEAGSVRVAVAGRA